VIDRGLMIEIANKRTIFDIKEIWFSNSLYDIDRCSMIAFKRCPLNLPNNGFHCAEELTSVIDLRQDLENIWQNMKKDSCRHSITRAIKHDVEIKWNKNLDEFYEIYKAHLKRKKYLRIPDDKSVFEKYGTLITAELDGEILAGRLYIEDDDHIVSYRGASRIFDNDKSKRTLEGNASHLIHWEAIKYAKAKGIKEFDMGGLWTDSINAMKESFGGRRVSYCAYWKDYSSLYKLTTSAADRILSSAHKLSQIGYYLR
jgi:lipid II:glycine glycyltransferase (peptidoglycan interpeptide bridge formation enzyme)